MKLLITDEPSMVSSDLWINIKPGLGKIFMMIAEIAFTGLSVMAVADLLQLLSVKEKLMFPDTDSMKHLLDLQLWHLFKYAELTEV